MDTKSEVTPESTKTQDSCKKSKKIHFEFSKVIIIALILAFFQVLVLGNYVVLTILKSAPEYAVQALVAIFSYVMPVSLVGIRQYMIKAEKENINKYPNIQSESCNSNQMIDPNGNQNTDPQQNLINETENQIDQSIQSSMIANGMSYQAANDTTSDLTTEEQKVISKGEA
jgi:hypothetical protein